LSKKENFLCGKKKGADPFSPGTRLLRKKSGRGSKRDGPQGPIKKKTRVELERRKKKEEEENIYIFEKKFKSPLLLEEGAGWGLKLKDGHRQTRMSPALNSGRELNKKTTNGG